MVSKYLSHNSLYSRSPEYVLPAILKKTLTSSTKDRNTQQATPHNAKRVKRREIDKGNSAIYSIAHPYLTRRSAQGVTTNILSRNFHSIEARRMATIAIVFSVQ